MLFRLSTFGVVVFLVVVVGGGAIVGVLIGREMRERHTTHLKEASGALQTALLTEFGMRYARQAVADHEEWRQAAGDGRIPVSPPE